MRSVAVIGAGPAGLVATKTLLHSYPQGTFRVSVLEQSPWIGGLWAVDSALKDGPINPEMRTNLTQFTVFFSDLSLGSVEVNTGLNANCTDETTNDFSRVPMYPKAWQVDRYLQQYYKKFVPAGIVSFNTQVIHSERVQQDGRVCWKLVTVDPRSKEPAKTESMFDYVIVSSGFFSHPRMVSCKLDNIVPGQSPTPVIHSSQFRKLSDLSTTDNGLKGVKVLVIGGSHSGSDIAASLALQMSNDRYSPSANGGEPGHIVHIMPRPVYAIPPFVQAGNETGAFLPLDFLLYDLAKRPPGSISFSFGRMTPQKARGLQKMIQSISGVDQHEWGFQETEKENLEGVNPPYGIVSEGYAEFVRSGDITTKVGRLQCLAKQNASQFLCGTVTNGPDVTLIEDVAAVVYATGYTASTALRFLPDEVKTQLEFDAACPRLPLLLESGFLTHTALIPDLAFIGFSDGPYWGVMEMQARTTAKRWAPDMDSGLGVRVDLDSAKVLSGMHDFRHAMAHDKLAVPQNLFGDYVGLMEQSSRELNLERVDLKWGEREGPICPARYIDSGADRTEAQRTMAKLQQTMDRALHQGAFVARATFRALQGTWKVRDKGCQDPEKIIAVARYHPRLPTDLDFDSEYLCIERSTRFADETDPEGKEQHLVYRYNEAADKISVWSVRDDNATMTNTLEYTLDFGSAGPTSQPKSWTAIGNTVNTVDNNHLTYTFHFSGVALRKFSREGNDGGEQKNGRPAVEFVR